MTIKARKKLPKKGKILSTDLSPKNFKRAKSKLLKSLPYALQQIADQLGVLSDLSLITDSKGNILLYGKPATDLKYNRKNLSGKNIFLC